MCVCVCVCSLPEVREGGGVGGGSVLADSKLGALVDPDVSLLCALLCWPPYMVC